jgi:hypothetical protein
VYTGIIASDAGVSEHLSLLVKGNEEKYLFNVSGVAANVFRNNSVHIKQCDLESILLNCREIIIGRSWQSNVGLVAIRESRKKSIMTSVYLDHWGFRNEEFMLDNELFIPDKFIVFDEFAFQEARGKFPTALIELQPNKFLEKIKSELAQLRLKNKHRISNQVLYLAEPIDLHRQKFLALDDELNVNSNFTEDEAFEFFLSNLSKISTRIESILIRPHPTQNIQDVANKYINFDERIKISTETNLLLDVFNSDFIAGCQTFGLVVGTVAGKETFSVIPPGKGELVIPLPGIRMLRNL